MSTARQVRVLVGCTVLVLTEAGALFAQTDAQAVTEIATEPSRGSAEAGRDRDQSPSGPENPYASAELSSQWTASQPPAPEPERKVSAEPPPPSASEKEPTADKVADDTGHVVPLLSWGKKVGVDEPPYSVGGVTAVVGKQTFFKFYGFLQTRYVTGRHVEEDGDQVAGGGFSLARARLFFYGGLTDWMRVLIRVGTTSDGTARFEQAFVDFSYRDFSFRIGQFYLPVFQEQSLSPTTGLTLQASAVGAVFDGGQTQGGRVTWDLSPTRLHFFVTDGLRTGFTEVGSAQAADIALTTRVETIVGDGNYGQFNISSAFPGEPTALLLGGGLHYQSGGELFNDAVQLGALNLDATFKTSRANVGVSASVSNTENSARERFYNYGVVVQGGYFVLDETELYGRYEALGTSATSTEPQGLFRGLTGGFNQYFWPERGIRAIADFTYYFDPTVGTPIAVDRNSGVFDSSGPQWSARVQLNVLF